jgi:hypothetical protein
MWCTSTWTGVLQNLFFRIPGVKRFFKLPSILPPPLPEGFNPAKASGYPIDIKNSKVQEKFAHIPKIEGSSTKK